MSKVTDTISWSISFSIRDKTMYLGGMTRLTANGIAVKIVLGKSRAYEFILKKHAEELYSMYRTEMVDAYLKHYHKMLNVSMPVREFILNNRTAVTAILVETNVHQPQIPDSWD